MKNSEAKVGQRIEYRPTANRSLFGYIVKLQKGFCLVKFDRAIKGNICKYEELSVKESNSTELVMFIVDVAEFNYNTFKENYSDYIVSVEGHLYGNMRVIMIAPQNIYDEVSNLKEECVTITGVSDGNGINEI